MTDLADMAIQQLAADLTDQYGRHVVPERIVTPNETEKQLSMAATYGPPTGGAVQSWGTTLAADERVGYRLWVDGAAHLVEMPAIPLDEFRYLDGDRAPHSIRTERIFIDGSSWWWPLAVRILGEDDSAGDYRLG